ncbi:MAG: formylglycine-generating enzyme family protein [Puniceicoccaceae bacterium]
MKRLQYRTLILSLFLLSPLFLFANLVVETVLVGGANNPPNPEDGDFPELRRGTVSYDYYIGTYEVTNAQYATFLNAVASAGENEWLYGFNMGAKPRGGILRSGSKGSYTYELKEGMANKPVNYLSLWKAMAFCNWLTNGQGNSDPNTGMYDLTDPQALNSNTVTRNPDAWAAGGVAVASQNEWYKAAYYDASSNGPADDWWLYPTRSDLEPAFVEPNSDNPNSANLNFAVSGGPTDIAGFPTDVGAYTAATTFVGAYDMAGNVTEFNDTIYQDSNQRVIGSGGSFLDNPVFISSEGNVRTTTPGSELMQLGFRVTSLQPIGASGTTWGLWPVDGGYVDTGSWMGWLWVDSDPYVWSFSLSQWLFVPGENVSQSGAWVYIQQ